MVATAASLRPPPARGGGAGGVTPTILLQVAVGGLLMGLIYALVAAGLSLIFGLMDVVNFAHGELLMLAMYATYVVWLVTGLDPLLLLIPVAHRAVRDGRGDLSPADGARPFGAVQPRHGADLRHVRARHSAAWRGAVRLR